MFCLIVYGICIPFTCCGQSFFQQWDVEELDADAPAEWVMDFLMVDECARAKKSHQHMRDYNHRANSKEKADIGYIVTTLGLSSKTKIATSYSSLEKAGERVNHIHPLRFLECIFLEEEFKAGFHGLHSRGGYIWSSFFDGLKTSLDQESSRANMSVESIQDFANRLKLDPNLILSPVLEKRWNDFVQVLLVQIPRQGDPGRYNM